MSRGDVAAAIADFEESEALFRSVGQEFAALQARHDLGCALATLGDLPRALQLFDEVSTRSSSWATTPRCHCSRAPRRLLLGGLSADALIFSQDAARRLHAEGNQFAAAKRW